MSLPDIDHIKFSHLPDELRRIERAIDRATALKFAAIYGGTRLSIPGWAHIAPDHRLALEFGQDTAIEISKAYETGAAYGVVVDVPAAKEEFFMRGVYRYFMLGLSADEIASELGCHRTQVFRTLKAFREAEIIPTDPLAFLSEEQSHWLAKLFESAVPPKSDDEKARLARALRVPRTAIDTFSKHYKTQGNS